MRTGAADGVGADRGCADATARLGGGPGSGHRCVHPAVHTRIVATHHARDAAADDRGRADPRMCRSIAPDTAA
jgi:hypothetical protein